MKLTIPVSVGELLDKITILQLKYENDPNNKSIHDEIISLTEVALINNVYKEDWIKELKEVNQILWDAENKIRCFEQQSDFDDEFVETARSIYITNDKRASIKRNINENTNSEIKEFKFY